MKNHVTVVPIDKIITVDGESLLFAYPAPSTLHALQWHNGQGHIEWRDDINHPLTAEDYEDDVAPFVALWEVEKARLDEIANRPPEPPEPPTLEEQRTAIDAETSAAILGGFDYTVRGEKLHFNYDAFDQQNFSDTANACILAMQGVPGLPENVTWNAYRDGHLTRVNFTAAEFLTLYTVGALTHKATQMEIGGQRKAALDAAGASA